MAVVIRLSRHGMKKKPIYRVVAADKERPRDGKYLEVLGIFNPKDTKNIAKLDMERLQYWVSKGAIPSHTVLQILKRTEKETKSSSAA